MVINYIIFVFLFFFNFDIVLLKRSLFLKQLFLLSEINIKLNEFVFVFFFAQTKVLWCITKVRVS